jgi:hypothetical protein
VLDVLQSGPIRVGTEQNLATNDDGRERFTRKRDSYLMNKKMLKKINLLLIKPLLSSNLQKKTTFIQVSQRSRLLVVDAMFIS